MSMGQMSQVLGAIWQQSQDKHSPLQQPDVDGTQRNRKKHNQAGSSSPSDYSDDDDDSQDDSQRAKSRKFDRDSGREMSAENDDGVSVHANDDDDNVSALMGDSTKGNNVATVSPDVTPSFRTDD